MDWRERANDKEEGLRAALDGRQVKMWTALPGIIEAFDESVLTATVQPAIQGRVSQPDGSSAFIDLPLLLDCPVMFPNGGGVMLTFPVKQGDECLMIFSSRCIDAWWESGGVQAPMEARMHDLSDGFVLVGPRSKARKIDGLSTANAQLRSEDGATFIELDPEGQAVQVTAPGGFTVNADAGATINANTTINGTLHVTGTITTDSDVLAPTGDVVAGTVSLKTHTHSGVLSGGAISGPPVP
jgi:phage baseplate assembly protein gpV